MNYIIFAIFFLFGAISVYLLTKSVYSLFYLLLIRLNGVKTTAYITGYDEKTYYTKRIPSRLVHLYYPTIKYKVNNKTMISKTTNIFNKNTQNYSFNDEISIYYNKKQVDQIFINNDCNYFQYILVLGFGFLYLFLMYFVCGKMLIIDTIFNIVNMTIGLIVALFFLLARLMCFSFRGYINEAKINKYCMQNSIIYMLIMLLLLLCLNFI